MIKLKIILYYHKFKIVNILKITYYKMFVNNNLLNFILKFN